MSIEFQLDSFISIFFTAGAVLASLLFALNLFFRKNRTRSNIFLGLLLALGSFTLLNGIFANAGIYSSFENLYFIPLTYTLSFGPLTYFYVQTKINPGYDFKKIHLIHAVLPVAQALFYFSVGFRDYEFKSWLWENVISVWAGDTESALFFLSFPGYIIAAARRIKKEKRVQHPVWKVKQLHWLRRFLYVFLALIMFQFLYDLLDFALWTYYNINIYNISWASFPLDMSKALAWYWVAFNGFQNARPELFNGSASKRKERYSLSGDDLDRQLHLLDDFFAGQKPHLNPDFNLQALAGELNLPPNKVSYIINEGKQLNFNDYVNEFRVEEVKRRLLDPQFSSHTILSIALDSGFNSKATFNRVFKAKTGLTPKQFLNRNK